MRGCVNVPATRRPRALRRTSASAGISSGRKPSRPIPVSSLSCTGSASAKPGGRLGERPCLLQVVQRGRQAVGAVLPDVGRLREIEQENFARDSGPPQRDPLLRERDRETVPAPSLSRRRPTGPAPWPYASALSTGMTARPPPTRSRRQSIVSRDRRKVDRGERRPQARTGPANLLVTGEECQRAEAARRRLSPIRTARATGPRSSRRSCGPRGRRAGSLPWGRCAAWRR